MPGDGAFWGKIPAAGDHPKIWGAMFCTKSMDRAFGDHRRFRVLVSAAKKVPSPAGRAVLVQRYLASMGYLTKA